MIQFLDAVARGVVDLLAARDNSAECAEEAHISNVRLGGGLEHECGERRVVVRVNLHHLAPFSALEGVEFFHFEGVGHQRDEEIEHGAHTDHALGRTTEEREEILTLHRFLHRGHFFVTGQVLTPEETFEQRIVGGGNRLNHFLVIAPEAFLLPGRNVHLFVLARLSRLGRHIGFLREEIDDTRKARAGADRDFDWNNFRSEPILDGAVREVEIGVILVHHRNGEEHRIFSGNGFAEHPFGTRFDACRAAHQHERAIGRAQAGNRIALEVEESRRVDQVHFRAVPLRKRTPERNRILPFDFLGRGVRERVAVLDRAVPF